MDVKKEHFNLRYLNISLYVIMTCVVIYILSRIADNAGVIFAGATRGVTWLFAILRPVVIGFVIAYLCYPLTLKMEKFVGKIPFLKKKEKSKRPITVAILFVVILLLLFLVGSFLVSVVTRQFTTASLDSFMNTINGYASSLEQLYNKVANGLSRVNIDSTELKQAADEVSKAVGGVVLGIANSLGSSMTNIVQITTTLLFAIIFAVYFLLDEKGLKKYWGNAVRIILPDKAYFGLEIFIKDLDEVFSGYIRGQMMDAVFMAVVVTIAFTIAKVPYAPAIGFLTGAGNLVPYMGPIVGYGSSIVVGLVSGDVKRMIISIIILFIIQTIDGNVINPKFLANSISVHPMLVLIAVIFGNKIGGLIGMVLAVPVAALIKIWFERFLDLINKKRMSADVIDPSVQDDTDEKK